MKRSLMHIFVFGCILLFAKYVFSKSTSLYSPKDQLWELDSSNFKSLVYGKSSAWIIQFYNSWCGHCIRFSRTWKAFASDTKMWRKVLDVGAINCNDPENVKTCRDYEVQSFPTIKLFWHNVNESDMGEDLSGKRDVTSIEQTAIKFLESNWHRGVPGEWPDFSALEADNVKDVVKSIPANEECLYLFVEEEESFIGRQVILDLSFQTSVSTRRVLNTNTKLLNGLQPGIYNGSVPTFIKIHRTGEEELVFRFPNNTSSTFVRDEIFFFVVGHRKDMPPKTSNDTKEDSTADKLIAADSVYMMDLENAVYNALNQEVGVSKLIDGEKFSTLKSFLSILKSYFPGSPPIMAYLSKLYNWVSYKKRSLTGEEFIQGMEQLKSETEYLPGMRTWMGCRGSELKYRGYPCSLWTLFHTLTVQANNEFTESHGYSETAGMTLFVIRDYIKHFFTCNACVKHFGEMAANLEDEVNSSKSAVLWLWEAHNRVNNRLAGDMTEDPKHPKIQFPSPKSCPDCRVKGDTFNDTQWDRSTVLEYLHTFYSKENIKSETSKTEESSITDQKRNNARMVNTFQNNSFSESWSFQWFTNTDISLCVSLYVISAVLLIVIFLIFRQRQRRRRLKKYFRFSP